MEEASDSALSSPPSSPRLSPSSSPLSLRSKSPTPPCDYPSPSSTLLSGSRSPSKALDSSLSVVDPDGPPPKKKRKLAEQMTRTTEYLDLRTIDEISQYHSGSNYDIQLQRLLKALRNKQKIVVIAGAGISVSAGSKIALGPASITLLTHDNSSRLSIFYRLVQVVTRPAQIEGIRQTSVRRVRLPI
jgi:NAD+-dependent protein deacetylase SIR2